MLSLSQGLHQELPYWRPLVKLTLLLKISIFNIQQHDLIHLLSFVTSVMLSHNEFHKLFSEWAEWPLAVCKIIPRWFVYIACESWNIPMWRQYTWPPSGPEYAYRASFWRMSERGVNKVYKEHTCYDGGITKRTGMAPQDKQMLPIPTHRVKILSHNKPSTSFPPLLTHT